ncbi:MAG TPA: NAD(P)/FAD-dependent oxidoreductase [Thermoanaerobaculia bacterium]|nr:NAD(P)/FAD-dependent oxidoreductase [Thermoanaerobaculia bacterium]
MLPVVVVGAGPAGLAVAGALACRGVPAILLEAGEAPGAAWRRHYPFLRLHTTRRDSSLPGRPMPGGGERYPGRDEYARYLEDYARWLGADVRPGREVLRVRRGDGAWEVEARGGDDDPRPLRARHVVIAAGFNRRPVRPELPGEEAFGGPVLHSSRWHELGDVAGRRVLVAGLGNTGADLVEELHRTGGRVAVAVRGPVHLVPLEMAGVNWRIWYRLVPGLAFLAGRLGKPLLGRLAPRAAAAFWCAVARARFGDLEGRGLRLQRSEELVAHWRARRPPLTSGPFVEAIRRGAVEVLPALAGFEPGAALLADGGRHPCDAVVLATGFRPALEEILQSEALPEPGGWPPDGHPGPLPGLWFCGYLPELLRIRRSARRLARRVAADLARRPGPA